MSGKEIYQLRDIQRLSLIHIYLDALVICGNGTDVKTLEEANISDADVFVAATGCDEANLLSCILVKEYDVPKIIARPVSYTHLDVYKRQGIF